jgi:DNA-binding CsgD family transcriptional regulator
MMTTSIQINTTAVKQSPKQPSAQFSGINRFSAPQSSPTETATPHPDRSKRLIFLHSILEGFVDGLLIVTCTGEVLLTNTHARRLCRQIQAVSASPEQLPAEVQRVCRALVDSRQMFPDQKIAPETELETPDGATIRVRVQWIELDAGQPDCLLVTLEDRSQSMQNLAIADARKYGFTPRETEVWALRRTGCSYKEIAARLYISQNTVKRHVKNILAKARLEF